MCVHSLQLTCRLSLCFSSFAIDCLAADRSFRSPGISSEAFAFACTSIIEIALETSGCLVA